MAETRAVVGDDLVVNVSWYSDCCVQVVVFVTRVSIVCGDWLKLRHRKCLHHIRRFVRGNGRNFLGDVLLLDRFLELLAVRICNVAAPESFAYQYYWLNPPVDDEMSRYSEVATHLTTGPYVECDAYTLSTAQLLQDLGVHMGSLFLEKCVHKVFATASDSVDLRHSRNS